MEESLTHLILSVISKNQDIVQDETAIQQVIQDYFDGTKHGDVSLIKNAFHEHAKLKHIKVDGSLYEADMNHFTNYLKTNGGMPVLETQILNMEVVETAAKAKVIFVFKDFVYIDFLNLLKVNNQWKIVDKVYIKKSVKS